LQPSSCALESYQELAKRDGSNGKIAMHREAQGVNLFLHIESLDQGQCVDTR
tara:strand:- start:3858 stop:4013 length:156 start_codon:yes stop_codon:yes gene_type:complete